jgi:hypothetical protein
MNRSVYLDRGDERIVEEEERNLFIKGVLEQIGVPLEGIWPDILLTVEAKIKLRDLLSELEIEIIDNGDREYEVYYQNAKLAKWFKPKFIMRKDIMARTLAKKLYYEMIVNTWSVFDQEENEND